MTVVATADGSHATVEFFLDCSCPWSYLALGRVREAAIRTSAQVIYRPVLVGDVLERANPGFPASRIDPVTARARYQAKDLGDWARYCGLTLRHPEPWPIRAEWAMRGLVVANRTSMAGRDQSADKGSERTSGNRQSRRRQDQAVAYLTAVFEALFRDNQPVADLEVVEAIATSAGFDAAEFARQIRQPDTLAIVQDNAVDLVARGGFGTPSFLVGTDLFFGNDRMPLVELALARQGGMSLTMPGAHGA
ncbi:MAG: 2-hydroxychromene-2-carboxylate isomerase [Gammaproteobacteria bacterium]